jgi:hypothetical protein
MDAISELKEQAKRAHPSVRRAMFHVPKRNVLLVIRILPYVHFEQRSRAAGASRR